MRLNKVIREFNISLERVVEYLSSKGHEIDARPTSKISDEQYSLLSQEFSSDRSSKVESHDLSEEKKKEKEELRIKFEKEQFEKEKNQVITSSSSIPKFKKVGLDTAKSILEHDLEDLAKRTDLEEETIADVRKILSEEFEDN